MWMYSCSGECKKVEFNLRHGLRLVRPRLHEEPSGRPILATQPSELEIIQNRCAEAGFPEGPWRANHPEEMKMDHGSLFAMECLAWLQNASASAAKPMAKKHAQQSHPSLEKTKMQTAGEV